MHGRGGGGGGAHSAPRSAAYGHILFYILPVISTSRYISNKLFVIKQISQRTIESLIDDPFLHVNQNCLKTTTELH